MSAQAISGLAQRRTTPEAVGQMRFPAEVNYTECSYRLALRARGRPHRRAQARYEQFRCCHQTECAMMEFSAQPEIICCELISTTPVLDTPTSLRAQDEPS
jgi:hypothetical protein